MGLRPGLYTALQTLGATHPTPVQQAAIPPAMNGLDVLLSSATGEGKTLAYLLPLAHRLKVEEVEGGLVTRPGRPRCLVLVPTRELALQVASVAKALCHKEKFRVLALVGGKKEGLQRRALENPVDMVVATTGRLLRAVQGGWCHLTDVRSCAIDEVDTMLCAGEGRVGEYGNFDADLVGILKALGAGGGGRGLEDGEGRDKTASSYGSRGALNLARVKGMVPDSSSSGSGRSANPAPSTPPAPKVQFILAGATIPPQASREITRMFPGLHRAIASSAHKPHKRTQVEFVRVADGEREGKHTALLTRLPDLVAQGGGVLVFCNSIPCARSTALTLGEAGWAVSSLHGGLPPQLREAEFGLFKEGKCPIMVATDSAARGLDFEGGVGSVVLFDFPNTPVEYLHRVGRTSRGVSGRAGRVIALIGKKDTHLASSVLKAWESGSHLSLGQELEGLGGGAM